MTVGVGKKSSLVCKKVYSAESGDNCFSVAQTFNLTTEFFSALNPNLSCVKIFVGQWLCIKGSASN